MPPRSNSIVRDLAKVTPPLDTVTVDSPPFSSIVEADNDNDQAGVSSSVTLTSTAGALVTAP